MNAQIVYTVLQHTRYFNTNASFYKYEFRPVNKIINSNDKSQSRECILL